MTLYYKQILYFLYFYLLDSYFRTAIGITPCLTLIRRNSFYNMISDVLGMAENLSNKFIEYIKDVRKMKLNPSYLGYLH